MAAARSEARRANDEEMTTENGRSIRPGACPERIERPNSAIQPFDFSQRGHRPVPKDAGRPKPIFAQSPPPAK